MKIILVFLLCLVGTEASAFGAWEQKTDFAGIARHRTVMIGVGNRVYTGLGHYNGGGTNILFNDWWAYDPSTGSWTQKADYAGGNCYHATGFAMNNIAFVGTGRTSPTGNTLVQDFFKYDPVTNIWTQISDFPGIGRRGAVSFVVGDYAYVGTGETNSGRSSAFYRFSPASGTWSPISSMMTSRTSAVAFGIDSYGYVGTGNTSSGSTNDFQRYNPTTDSWEMMSNVGPISRQEACGFAIGGKGYIGTGDDFSSGNNFKDMWEFDPTLGTWVQIGDFAGTARRYLSGTTVGGNAYVGLGTNGTNLKDFWRFDQTVSLIEQNLSDLEIVAYPNPTVESIQFVIKWNDNVPTSEMHLNITSLTGRIVYTAPLDVVKEIQTSKWNAGNYIYSLMYDNQIVKSGHLIVL